MALVIESGSVVAGADSYATVAEFSTYASNRGIDISALSDTTIEQNLRKAFDYLLQKYRHSWAGYRTSETQPADWPRNSVYIKGTTSANLIANTVVPNEVKTAQIELAIKANTDDLMADLEQQEIELSLGPLKVINDPNSPQAKRYSKVDAMLRPYLKNPNSLTVTAHRA